MGQQNSTEQTQKNDVVNEIIVGAADCFVEILDDIEKSMEKNAEQTVISDSSCKNMDTPQIQPENINHGSNKRYMRPCNGRGLKKKKIFPFYKS